MQAVQNIFQQIFGRWSDDPNDQQYYVKMTFALISAVICAAGGQAFAGTRGLMIGLLIYALSLYVVVYLVGINPEDLGGRQKLVTNTLPSYLLLWVLIWTVLYAFTLPPEVLENLCSLVTESVIS
jgi:amino acid permease